MTLYYVDIRPIDVLAEKPQHVFEHGTWFVRLTDNSYTGKMLTSENRDQSDEQRDDHNSRGFAQTGRDRARKRSGVGVPGSGRVRPPQDRCPQCPAASYPSQGRSVERQDFRGQTPQANPAMILVDTGVIVAWLDPEHPAHVPCTRALEGCAAVDELAISVVSWSELAGSGRSRQALEADLHGFRLLAIEPEVAFRAGNALHHSGERGAVPSLLDFLVWSQAAVLKVPLLTLEARILGRNRAVEILVPILRAGEGRTVASGDGKRLRKRAVS